MIYALTAFFTSFLPCLVFLFFAFILIALVLGAFLYG